MLDLILTFVISFVIEVWLRRRR